MTEVTMFDHTQPEVGSEDAERLMPFAAANRGDAMGATGMTLVSLEATASAPQKTPSWDEFKGVAKKSGFHNRVLDK